MARNEPTIEALEKQHKAAQAEAKRLERELAKGRRAAANQAYRDLVDAVRAHGPHLPQGQRNTLIRLLGGDGTAPSSSTRAAGKGSKKARKSAKRGGIKPLFQLPSGETWAGRGKPPTLFNDWARSAEGKEWRAANPTMPWPVAPNAAADARAYVERSAATLRKNARWKVGGAAKAPAKATKKAAKKSTVRKATRRKKAAKKAAS